MKRGTVVLIVVLLVTFGVLASGALAQGSESTTYLILAKGNKFKASLTADVAAAGGTLETVYPFGIAVASSSNPSFASAVPGVSAVVADNGFDASVPQQVAVGPDFGFPPNSGDDDPFFDLQWGHNYVRAQQAWEEGVRGQGVRVAVLDGGLDLDHPDIAPNLNLALSADFSGEGLQYGLPDPFSHATHVAGTILGADNGFGIIGVAPEAELVMVKVLGDAGSGSFADVIAGIYYAASVDADIINMSLGTYAPRNASGNDITKLDVAVSQAVAYAYQQGTTVIVSGGNDAQNLDGDGNIVRFMETAEHSIPISALGPQNWATFPDQALAPASYTNYGTSGIDFGAPGGDFIYPGNENCVVAGLVRPCWVFDLVFSAGNNGWYWSAGTSMAAPHAAGIAALIISENGGDMHPAQVKSEMRHRAEDMGKPGRDDFFGHGLVQSGY